MLEKGILNLSTPTNLMSVPAIAAQILDRDHVSAGDHLESSKKEFQALLPVTQSSETPTKMPPYNI